MGGKEAKSERESGEGESTDVGRKKSRKIATEVCMGASWREAVVCPTVSGHIVYRSRTLGERNRYEARRKDADMVAWWCACGAVVVVVGQWMQSCCWSMINGLKSSEEIIGREGYEGLGVCSASLALGCSVAAWVVADRVEHRGGNRLNHRPELGGCDHGDAVREATGVDGDEVE
jgi:hypothetical protein